MYRRSVIIIINFVHAPFFIKHRTADIMIMAITQNTDTPSALATIITATVTPPDPPALACVPDAL